MQLRIAIAPDIEHTATVARSSSVMAVWRMIMVSKKNELQRLALISQKLE
ncbi:hypothetical protein [Chroococcidiopsis sp.]